MNNKKFLKIQLKLPKYSLTFFDLITKPLNKQAFEIYLKIIFCAQNGRKNLKTFHGTQFKHQYALDIFDSNRLATQRRLSVLHIANILVISIRYFGIRMQTTRNIRNNMPTSRAQKQIHSLHKKLKCHSLWTESGSHKFRCDCTFENAKSKERNPNEVYTINTIAVFFARADNFSGWIFRMRKIQNE